MKPIEKLWHQFHETVIPDDASQIQIDETRKAFYAGAWALMQLVTSNVSDGPNVEPQDIAMLEEINQEFEDWIEKTRQSIQ